jgi:putative transposase
MPGGARIGFTETTVWVAFMVRPRTVKEKSMPDYQSLTHTRWDCKYHVVFIPKRRKKVIYGKLRKYLREVFHDLAKRRGAEIVEGHMMADHVHMCISIPPKYSVSNTVGYIKGKSAIAIPRELSRKAEEFQRRALLGKGLLCIYSGIR